MWSRLNKLFDDLGSKSSEQDWRDEEQMLAAAALMVRAMVIDGEATSEERQKLSDLLMNRFALTSGDAEKLIASASEKERDAVDLYGFTSVLARDLDQAGRKAIVSMLWEMVLADGVIHEFESNLVWRVAELLGVSTRDRILLRKQVERGAGSR